MISNRCARKSLVTNCNSIISKNYSRFLVDSNEKLKEQTPTFLYYLQHRTLSTNKEGRMWFHPTLIGQRS